MIHVENLTKYYKELCAVDRINFDVQKGEILGLLGPNGAGKTTTLRMLTGFLRPTAGSIRVKEFNIEEQALEIKRIMGYLPESAPLYHEMLVYDYLDYIANIREIDPSRKLPRIRQLADLCGLNSVMHQPVSELSKGFKQRVGLAHAMLNDPEILVLDEPTSAPATSIFTTARLTAATATVRSSSEHEISCMSDDVSVILPLPVTEEPSWTVLVFLFI